MTERKHTFSDCVEAKKHNIYLVNIVMHIWTLPAANGNGTDLLSEWLSSPK